jgi:hypothetical protein
MTAPNVRLLQLNIWKSRSGMEALINDSHSQNLDILLIQEPPLTAYNTHVNHSAWHLYQSTCLDDVPKKRSLLYVSRRISTTSNRQIQCNHADVTAVKLWTTQQQTLILSVYVPYMDYRQNYEETSIQPMLWEIETCIRQATETTPKSTTIIMAGDFNRHHPMWCKDRVHHGAIELAEELVSFFPKTWTPAVPAPRHPHVLVYEPSGEPLDHRSHCKGHTGKAREVPPVPRPLRIGPSGNLFRVVPPTGPQYRSQTSKSVRSRRLETDRRSCPSSDVRTSPHPNEGRTRWHRGATHLMHLLGSGLVYANRQTITVLQTVLYPRTEDTATRGQ